VLKRSHILIFALALLTSAVASGVPRAAADVTCSNSCKAQYGSCYKSSQDRNKCQSQLQRCLEACIRKKR
jgi:hypothetical protein